MPMPDGVDAFWLLETTATDAPACGLENRP
jgi:hypothetical protein